MKVARLALVMSPLLIACVSIPPPKDLMDARAAYDGAAMGPAGQLDPAQLHVAREELTAAERTFTTEGDTFRTRDLAYIALRQAQIADARARAMDFDQKYNLAEHQVVLTQAEQAARAVSREQATAQQLVVESQRREAAEKRAQHALADLTRIASVKQDNRGTVITLSGGVFFASGKADLLPAAQANLAEIADALTKSDPDSKLQVTGYTDSQGNDSFNMDLSRRRAEAVGSFLIAHGVAPDRIMVQGLGSSQPVADNMSAEGRAENRRVEIVVQPPRARSTP